MYGREIDGRITTFGTTGYTYRDVFLLYDRYSQTVWHPLSDTTMDGVGGKLLGQQIPFIEKPPVVTLEQWRLEHPDTLVLLGDADTSRTSDESNAPTGKTR